MADRENVIFQLSETYKILEIVTPHFNQIMDYQAMIQGCKDAIAMLKEQEAVKPTWGRGKPFCGACGLQIRGGKFCSECGKPILWEGR